MYNNFYQVPAQPTYNPLQEQFNEAMQRESKTITTYYTNRNISCLFRRNSDSNDTKNRTTIFYPVTANLQQGQLIKYKNEVYILLNQETAECDVYLKSDIIKTNCSISTVSSGTELYIPCYSGDMLGILPDDGKFITTLQGYSEVITEDCPNVHNLTLGATFDGLGHTFKVENYIYKDGLCYIYIQQTQSEQKEYTIKINSALTSYNAGDTKIFTAVCKYGNNTTEEIITNATVKWSSSNTAIATINDNGTALFLAEGSVTFSCVWLEHNKISNILISVSKPFTPSSYVATITGSDILKIGGSPRSFTGKFTDETGAVIELVPKWTFECLPENLKYFTLTYPSATTCSIKVADNIQLVGTTVKLLLADENNLCRTDKTINIAAAFG